MSDWQKIFTLVRIFLAFLSLEVYSLLPYSEKKYSFFPYHPQQLTLQVWVDYACTRLGFLILLYQIYRLLPQLREQMFIMGLLAAGYVVDYFLRYNMPFPNTPIPIIGINLSYTLFMTVCFGLILLRTYMDLKEKLL